MSRVPAHVDPSYLNTFRTQCRGKVIAPNRVLRIWLVQTRLILVPPLPLR